MPQHITIASQSTIWDTFHNEFKIPRVRQTVMQHTSDLTGVELCNNATTAAYAPRCYACDRDRKCT
jgi:hypothetical protein